MPKQFSRRALAWVKANQGRYFCGCGCGEAIPLRPQHCYDGPPGFRPGHHLNAHRPVAERFWRYVVKTDGCWLWTGGKANGYGRLRRDEGPFDQAHRISWEMHRGPIPEGIDVLHNCPGGDNPGCVNPDHLWLGTHTDNMRDRSAKGRRAHTRGERNPNARLSAAAVLAIREAHGSISARDLMRLHGVSKAAIYRIWNGTAWAEEPDAVRRPPIDPAF